MSRGTLLHSVIDSSGLPVNRKLLQLSGTFCQLFSRNPAKLAKVRCPGLCAETLFVLLLKFGAVLSIICGFLVAVYVWIHLLQCTVVVWSFLRLIKLHKLAVC